jgi:hypothetical protein
MSGFSKITVGDTGILMTYLRNKHHPVNKVARHLDSMLAAKLQGPLYGVANAHIFNVDTDTYVLKVQRL